MSFSWKGLLGVNNQNTPASSSASPSTSVAANGAAASSANTANHATPNSFAGNSTATSSSAGASAMSTSASRTALNANPYSATQNPTPPVPLFGAMIPGSTSYHSTSFIPSSASTTQSSIISRKPSEIPVNSVEGGGYLLGMENFGNTCYVNSIIQSLYFCRPFRDSLLSYKSAGRERSESDAGSQHGIHTIGDIASRTLPDPTPEAIDGVPPSDTMFAALRDLFDVFQQSGQQKALSSPTRSTAPGSLPLSSPISPSPPTFTPADPPAVTRKTSILGRPSTAGTTSGRGGAGGHAISAATVNASATAAQAIPITPNSVAGSGPPNLSISTSTIGTVASGFPSVDSNAVKAFLSTLKRENVLFDSTMHQDAHEMLNFVLNKVGEDLIDADKATKNRVKMQSRNPYLNARTESDKTVDAQRKRSVMEVGPNGKTCVHRLFEGVLTNETRCLTCETVTSRDECFLDLSIDIEKNSSVTSCLRQFSASEMLRSRNKFFCDSCSGLQEAEKRMKIKKLPNVLALHLKRFKYEETVQRYVKLAYRVVFPQELRLFNTSDDAEDPDRLYELCAIVVHIGAGPHHGHYIAVVKVGDRWVQFDDDVVTYIDEAEITKYYGDRPGLGSAYVLFYQAVDLDFEGLGLDDPALQAMIQQRVAASADADGRGRAGLKVPELADPRSNVSPDRSGAAPATANRSRLGSVTEGSAMSPTGTASSDAGQGSNGWFGSFRNREKRAGSQSRRRPKTGSSAEPAVSELPASTTAGDLAKLGAADVGGATPDDASVSTHSTAANDATSRGASGLTSASATPATEHTASRVLPSGSLASGEAGPSPVRTGFSTMDTMPGSTTDTDVSRATTESPSEFKYGRMLSNQGAAAVNREAREQNLMRGVMNRRARAASEGFSSSGMTAEAPLDTNGRSAVFGGNFVAEPEAGHHAVVTPSIVEPSGAAAAAGPTPSQREASSGSGFAPLERLLSSKNQKSQAKTARRASSSYTPLSPTAEKGDKKESMLSNLFSSSSSASSSAAQSKRGSMQFLSNGTNSNSAAAGAVEEGQQPTRKPSLSTRTLSKTFGFGRNKQG